MGYKSREAFHHTNWDEVAKDPGSIAKFTGQWLNCHDPECYADDNYDACAAHLLDGQPFQNTNTVPNYKFRLWTVQELLDKLEKGESIEDDGDWY